MCGVAGAWEKGQGERRRGGEGPTICFLNLYSLLLFPFLLWDERVKSIKVNNNYQLVGYACGSPKSKPPLA